MTSRIWRQISALLIFYIYVIIWKNFPPGSQNQKNVLKYVYPIKRYNVLKFEFPANLLLKIAKTQSLKSHIFWLERYIAKRFSVLRSL